MFGYDEASWDNGEDLCPAFCDESSWADLTGEQKEVFGYDEAEWDNEDPISLLSVKGKPTYEPTFLVTEGYHILN